MPRHSEKRALPYTAEQIFDLVADVDRYPEFLPWCIGARVRRPEPNVIDADLIIGTYCMEHGHSLLHADRDFDPMAEHLGLRIA